MSGAPAKNPSARLDNKTDAFVANRTPSSKTPSFRRKPQGAPTAGSSHTLISLKTSLHLRDRFPKRKPSGLSSIARIASGTTKAKALSRRVSQAKRQHDSEWHSEPHLDHRRQLLAVPPDKSFANVKLNLSSEFIFAPLMQQVERFRQAQHELRTFPAGLCTQSV